MSRPRSAQELVHWLEVGAGSRWVRIAAFVLGALGLSVLIAWKQFHGPTNETTLLQADVGRQLAAGQGFTTLVNFPQTAAVLERGGVRFDAERPYPELHHAPLYSLVIAGALRLLPAAQRDALFASAPTPPDGFAADYLLLALNLILLWLAAWQTFRLGSRLFEPRVGAVAALALLLSVTLWQETVALNGTPLLVVLALGAFACWERIESSPRTEAGRTPVGWLAGLGAACGLLFLAEYAAGALVLVALGYALFRFRGAARVAAFGCVLGGAVLVSSPWLARNIALTGNPVALAAQDVALKAGDSTAEPALVRASLSAERPPLDLKKLANKTLTSLQFAVKTRLWSGGALWFTAFFVTGWLYAFRSPVTNRLRWVFTAALGVLLLAQALGSSGEAERSAAVWLSPLMMIFGAGFFFVLLGSNATLAGWPKAATAVLLILQGLPLVRDALEPRRLHFHYPPYFPGLLQGMRNELAQRGVLGRFGIMADIPAGVAWYGRARVWAQPPQLRDFHAIALHQPIGELLLTPRTLDRPFFTELQARPVPFASLSGGVNRRGEWGEVYAGLLTGTMPRDFPLRAPHKLAENLYVLLDPTLPSPPGK